MPATRTKPAEAPTLAEAHAAAKQLAIADREQLLAQKQAIENQLEDGSEAERIRRRRELVAELASCELTDDAELAALFAQRAEQKKAIEATDVAINQRQAVRTAETYSVTSKRNAICTELEKTASRQIPLAIDELGRKIFNAKDRRRNQPSAGLSNAQSVDTFIAAAQAAQRQLQELRMSALSESELEATITRLFKRLPSEQFPMVRVAEPIKIND